jgi:hypothetical protein
MSTYLIFTGAGFFAWGQSLYNEDPWPIPVTVCLGLINLGVQLGTTGIVTYVVDCHREQAAEAFAIMNFVKNFFAFGGITMGVALLTVPMYVLGKRARSWTHRRRIITKIVEWTE